jgi:pimeloyl-ACP methyl ester carboxylesterase
MGHVRHLAAILHAESITRTHVVGHSSGASLSLQPAATYPGLVHTMVLLESAPSYGPDEPKSEAMRNAVRAAEDGDLESAFALFPGSVLTPELR